MAQLKDALITGDSRTIGRANFSSPINQIIVGEGTAAQDKGSGVSPRYFPAKWTFSTGLTVTDGDILTIKLPVAGSDYGVFMSIDNGSNYYPVVLNGTARLTTHFPVNTYITVVFEPTGSAASMFPLAGGDARVTVSGGVFRIINYRDTNDNTYTSAVCTTSASTAAKTATMYYYTLTANSYLFINFRYANSYAGAITLNVDSKGAKPIYINGAASSSTNYTLPAGSYLFFYDGTNYYFRTEGKVTGVKTSSGTTTMTLPLIYTGTADPTSAIGNNGDIYIKTA